MTLSVNGYWSVTVVEAKLLNALLMSMIALLETVKGFRMAMNVRFS